MNLHNQLNFIRTVHKFLWRQMAWSKYCHTLMPASRTMKEQSLIVSSLRCLMCMSRSVWGRWHSYLLIVCKATHDGRVYYSIQQHGQGVDGKVGVIQMSLHHVVDLLIGQLHSFHGILQGTNLLLWRVNHKCIETWVICIMGILLASGITVITLC